MLAPLTLIAFPHPCCMCAVSRTNGTLSSARCRSSLPAASTVTSRPSTAWWQVLRQRACVARCPAGKVGAVHLATACAHSDRGQHACACGRALAPSLSRALAPLQACQIPVGTLCPSVPELHHASHTVSCPVPRPAAAAAVPVPRHHHHLAAGITSGDAVMLELAAAEMAQAAALFVALEKEVEVLKAKGSESSLIQLKDNARWVFGREQGRRGWTREGRGERMWRSANAKGL